MKRIRLFVMGAMVLAATAAWTADLDRFAAKSMERPSGKFDRAAHFAVMNALQRRVAADAVDLAKTVPLNVQVTPTEVESVHERALRMQKMRVGLVRDLAVPLSFDRRSMTPHRAILHDTFGAVRGDDQGAFAWTGVVRSRDAAALRIHFTDVDLPSGTEMFVYTQDGMAFGPYTGRGPNGTGDFWSNTVAGAEVVVHLSAGAIGEPRFTIAGLGYLTSDFAIANHLRPVTNAANTKPCSFNADCTVDAACGTENGAVNVATDAVAHILFASGAYLYICTGGLVADSDTSSNIPYFMTANHCISRASEASSLETFFFYRASQCQSCPDPGAANTNGATIVSTSSKSGDYSLLRLSQNAPSGAAFLGWSSTAIANTNGVNLYRLSHPKGAPQAYSEHVVDTSKGTCRSWPRGSWIYSRDVLGATEGGSSGSPVVNGAGQLVGQLSGGCGFNVNDVCDTASNATVDGAFAAYYSSVSQYLGSGGPSCVDADGDGYCVSQGDCNDSNASIHPGANDTKGKVGRDGIDQDCDGTPDA